MEGNWGGGGWKMGKSGRKSIDGQEQQNPQLVITVGKIDLAASL